jgi:hypothetical protein
MNLDTSLLDIDSIHSPVKRSEFPESDLEQFALSIIKLGGLIKPIIVKRIDLENFEVIEGHFEYYASVKAKEIDSDLEMIRGFIISEENQDFVQQQIKLISDIYKLPESQPQVNSEIEPQEISYTEEKLEVISNQTEQSTPHQEQITIELQRINHIEDKLELIINQIQELTKIVSQSLTSSPEKVKPPKPDKSYDKMTVKELKDIAKEKNISGYSKMKKLELIKAIKKAEN